MTVPTPKRSAGRPAYDEEFKRDALLRWAMLGNKKAAAKEKGCSEKSLADWREQRPAVWDKIISEHSREMDVNLTGGIREASLKMASILNQTLEELAGKQHMISPEKLAQNAQQIAVAMSSMIEKTAMLENRPTQITEHRSAPELLAKLRAEFPGVIDSTAEDMDPSQATPKLLS